MLSANQNVQIQRFANALYGVQVGAQTLAAVEQEVAAANNALPEIFNAYYEVSFTNLTPAQVAARLVEHLEIAPSGSTIATNYIIEQLSSTPTAERGAKVAQMLELYSGLTADALFGDTASAWNEQVAAATTYAGAEDIWVGIGRAFNVASEYEVVTGTVFDDVFEITLFALGPNANGILINPGCLDGLAGQDSLEVTVKIASSDIAERSRAGLFAQNIETVSVKSEHISDSDPSASQSGQIGVRLYASQTSGVTVWESHGSTADLIIEGARIRNDQVTQDITVTMRDTAAGDVDFEVYFVPESVRSHMLTESLIKLEIISPQQVTNGTSPVFQQTFGGFTLTVTDKTTGLSTVETISSPEIRFAQTYTQLAVAFQNAFDKALGINMVAVTLGDDFNVLDHQGFSVSDQSIGYTVTGQQLKLSAVGPIALSTPADTSGWLGDGSSIFSVPYVNFFSSTANNSKPVVGNILLDNVGQGGRSGDLVVGTKGDNSPAESRGIDVFEIKVQGSSKLQSINSTHNALREVRFFNFFEYDPLTQASPPEAFGKLVISGQPSGATQSPTLLAPSGTYGLTDLQVIDGTKMRGDLEFSAEITQASVAKYLEIDNSLPNREFYGESDFAYNGGQGHDVMNIRVDSAVTGSTPLAGVRSDFVFSASGNEGNDHITVTFATPAGDTTAINAWYAQQSALQANSRTPFNRDYWETLQISIYGGSGDDTIRKPGWGDAYISADTGNDTVYTDNSGTGRSVWAIGHDATRPLQLSTNTNTTSYGGISNLTGVAAYNSALFLYGGKLTITLSEPGAISANQYQNGWEVTVDIPYADINLFTVTQVQINQAIVQAINNDAVLSKLLFAESHPSGSLSVTSLIDGSFVADDLRIEVSAPLLGDVSTSEQAGIVSAFAQLTSNPSASMSSAQAAMNTGVASINARSGMTSGADVFVALGAPSTAQTDNLISMGPGNNVLVLSTSATANETVLAFQHSSQEETSIVNFDDSSGSGRDHIDLRYLLSSEQLIAANNVSRIATSVTVGGGKTAPNSLHALTGLDFNTTNSFEGLTAERLLAALNQSNTGSMNYAGITETTLDAQTVVSG